MVGKKIKGRKRHIIVDIMGNLLHVKVHAANEHDSKAGTKVFTQTQQRYPSIEAYSGDAGYRGTAAWHVENIMKLKLAFHRKLKMGLLSYLSEGRLKELLHGLVTSED